MQPILFKGSLCRLHIGYELPTLWVCLLLSLKVVLVFYHKCSHARGQVLYLFYVPLLMVMSRGYVCKLVTLQWSTAVAVTITLDHDSPSAVNDKFVLHHLTLSESKNIYPPV